MEIMARRVEWQEAVRRQRTGTLHATIDEALDKGEPWVEWHELPFDFPFSTSCGRSSSGRREKGTEC